MQTNPFIINEHTIFYSVNIPISVDKLSNRFYFIFDTLPSKRELFKEIKRYINHLIERRSQASTPVFAERLQAVLATLDNVAIAELDDFLDISHRTYRASILNSEDNRYITINRINPRRVILGDDSREEETEIPTS